MGFRKPSSIKPPERQPDPADQAVRDALVKERQRQLGTSGRKSTFLTGALGDTGAVPTSLKKLIGG